MRNPYVHDNIIISRSTEAGSGRTGIVDMDGYTAYAVGNNRFVNNRYTLGNINVNAVIGLDDEVGGNGSGYFRSTSTTRCGT